MGRVKEWSMDEHECIVCGRMFLPCTCIHEVDIGAPTCSHRCYKQYHEGMNTLADMQAELPDPEPEEQVS